MTDHREAFANALRRKMPEILVQWRGERPIARDIEENLQIEFERLEDTEFAQRFAAACPVDGCEPRDYLQRVLDPGADQKLLTGIRFLSHPDFPFVDIVAATDPIDDAASLENALDAVLEEYREFAPRAVRLVRSAERPLSVPDGVETSVDQHIVVGPIDALSAEPPVENQEHVRLAPIDDVEEAANFVDAAYEEFFDGHPDFRGVIQPADAHDLRPARDEGALVYVHVDRTRAGLVATAETLGPLVRGQTVIEEVLASEFRGRGLAAAAQRHVIDYLRRGYPDALIRGTIDARNAASLATAKRAGREAVAAYHWLQR